jgi:MoaA/NifB/PqqE/SkfB family radical SAM enzyme
MPLRDLVPEPLRAVLRRTPLLGAWRRFQERPAAVRRRHLSPAFPRVVGVNFSVSRCFLRCRMCPQFTGGEAPGEGTAMTPDLFRQLLAQLPDRGDFTLEMASYGETLAATHWETLLAMAVEALPRAATVLVTNGVVLDAGAREVILRHPPSMLQVSIDAATAPSYRWLCGADLFSRSRENLRELMAERGRRGRERPRVQTHIIELEEFRDEIEAFRREWEGVVDVVNVRHLGNWGGAIDGNGLTPRWTPPDVRYPCAWPFFATKVMPDGEVHKCHIHFLSGAPGVGRLGEEPLAAIWRGERLGEVRRRQLAGEYEAEPMCARCNVWALFPNIWRPGEYAERPWSGRSWPGQPLLFGPDGRRRG